jgi:hypothetical protein
MNLIDFYVTEIISEPYFEYNKWWLDVVAITHGVKSKHQLMFNSKQECDKIEVGYKFVG